MAVTAAVSTHPTGMHPYYRPQGKVMFTKVSVILSSIGLMDTRSLFILVTARIRVLSCYIVAITDPFFRIAQIELCSSWRKLSIPRFHLPTIHLTETVPNFTEMVPILPSLKKRLLLMRTTSRRQ